MDLIANLGRALQSAGQDIVLRRVTGGVNYDATVRAAVRSFSPEEIAGGIAATAAKVVISPTQIAAAGWPGDGESGSPDPSIPRRNDKVVIAGRVRNVEAVNAIFVANVLVRIVLQVA